MPSESPKVRCNAAYNSLLISLRDVPHLKEITGCAGTSLDIEQYGYLFHENILPDGFELYFEAGIFVLWLELEKLGFLWPKDSWVTFHPKTMIMFDFSKLEADRNSEEQHFSTAIDDVFVDLQNRVRA
ncbi:MAG: hypothetical protein ABL888_21775 [Pirellulaceae bacterium]